MSAEIIRLHGEGATLVWPARRVNPLSKRVVLNRELMEQAQRENRPYRNIERLLRGCYECRVECAKAIAEANGWTFAPTQFDANRLLQLPNRQILEVIRHPEAYRWKGLSSRAAVIVHLYDELKLAELPPGLTVDRLPSSCYWPGVTEAYCFRRTSGSQRNSSTGSNPRKQ